MKNKSYIILLLAALIGLFAVSACEKEIDLELPDPENKLVIEGWIENGDYPVVVITRNSGYFDPVDSTTISNLFITDAVVKVSDGITTETLTLDLSNLFTQTWPFIMFKGDTLKGELNKTYTLTIETEGMSISGQTTIQNAYGPDTLYWKSEPVADTLGYIWATFSDNGSEKNYYRIFSKRLGRDKRYVPLYGSVYDDIFFNGESITFSMFRGVDSYSDDSQWEDEELGYFKKGDTVVIKFSSMDRQHFEFWRTVEQEFLAGGNPFSNPVTIRHNVEGALGVFGGYGSVYDTLIIQ